MNKEKFAVGQEVLFKWYPCVINARIDKILDAAKDLYEIYAYKGHISVPYKINVVSAYLQNNVDIEERIRQQRIKERNDIIKKELIEKVWIQPQT
jgi:hypothetical protein